MARWREIIEKVGETEFVGQLETDEDGAYFADEVEAFQAAIVDSLEKNGIRTPAALRFLRRAAGYSQRDLANLLDVDKARISDWENGRHGFSVSTWSAIVDLALREPRVIRRLQAKPTKPKARVSFRRRQ